MAQEKSSKSEILEGAEELLSEWGYALNEFAFSSREDFNNFLEIETLAANHWLKKTIGKLPKTKTAYEAAVKYRDLADERKIILKNNFKLEEKGEMVLGTFLSHDCPYKACCIARKNEGKKYLCFRATPFVIAMESMTDKTYRSEVLFEQTQPGSTCMVKGMQTQISFKVGLSYKLSRGTVKINEVDCGKVGIGIIDTVRISPSRKEIAGRKLNAMSYSQTKYPAGMILMSIADAKSLGLEEKDTIYVKKAGEKEEVSLVGEESYEAKPGEYEGEYETTGAGAEGEEEAEEKPKGEPKEKQVKPKPETQPGKKQEPEEEADPEKKPGEVQPKAKVKKEAKKPEKVDKEKNKKQMKDFESKIEALRDK